MKNGFKESHLRSFHSLVMVTEDKLQEMEALLCASSDLSNPDLQVTTISDLSKNERKQLLKDIDTMRQCLTEFSAAYGLKKQQRSLKKMLVTKAAFLWEEVSGATFSRLQGYGKVDPSNKDGYEKYTITMTAIAEKLMLIPKEK